MTHDPVVLDQVGALSDAATDVLHYLEQHYKEGEPGLALRLLDTLLDAARVFVPSDDRHLRPHAVDPHKSRWNLDTAVHFYRALDCVLTLHAVPLAPTYVALGVMGNQIAREYGTVEPSSDGPTLVFRSPRGPKHFFPVHVLAYRAFRMAHALLRIRGGPCGDAKADAMKAEYDRLEEARATREPAKDHPKPPPAPAGAEAIDESDVAILEFLNRTPILRRKVSEVLPETGVGDRKAIAKRLRKLADRTPPLVDFPKDGRSGVAILPAGAEALNRATPPTPR